MEIVIVTRNMRLFADFLWGRLPLRLYFCNHTACIGRSFLQCLLFMMRIEHEKTRWNIIWKMRLFADFWWRHLPPQTLPISQAFVATQGHRRKYQPWTMMLLMMMTMTESFTKAQSHPSVIYDEEAVIHINEQLSNIHFCKFSKMWKILCPKLPQNDQKPPQRS